MIEAKIYAKESFNFKNELGSFILTKGEVSVLPFKSMSDLEAHLQLGLIELADEDDPISKNIHILYKKDSSVPMENELLASMELSGNLDKLYEKEETELKFVDALYKKEEKKNKQNPWITAAKGIKRNEPQSDSEDVRGDQSEASYIGSRGEFDSSARSY